MNMETTIAEQESPDDILNKFGCYLNWEQALTTFFRSMESLYCDRLYAGFIYVDLFRTHDDV
jgi:hypothetical protein